MVRATSVHFPKDILRFGDLSYWSLRWKPVLGLDFRRDATRVSWRLLGGSPVPRAGGRLGEQCAAPLVRSAPAPAVSSGASCPRPVVGALGDRLDS